MQLVRVMMMSNSCSSLTHSFIVVGQLVLEQKRISRKEQKKKNIRSKNGSWRVTNAEPYRFMVTAIVQEFG